MTPTTQPACTATTTLPTWELVGCLLIALLIGFVLGHASGRHDAAQEAGRASAILAAAEATLDEAARLNAEARAICPTTLESNP